MTEFLLETHTHTHIACLIAKFSIEIEYISYTSYFKSKKTSNHQSYIILIFVH
jgi:hypothetical protein